MASRVPARVPAASRGVPRRPDRAAARRTNQLTKRAVILGLVVAGLVVSAALPGREYLAQRAEISKLQQAQAQAQARVAGLEQARRRLQDPAYVGAEARRRLHFVLPGETAYVLVEPPPQPTTTSTVPGSPAGPQAPWYSQLWGSVRAADRPAAK